MDTARDRETEHRETGGHRRQMLVAVDESDASERVVSFVDEFFAGLDVEVVGIRCVDLIVVGDNHKTEWRLLEGSVASDVQRRAPCPVLAVP